MSLRRVRIEEELRESDKRIKDIDSALEEVNKTSEEYKQRYMEIKDSDDADAINALFDDDQVLEERQRDLQEEKLELEERISQLKEELTETEGIKVAEKEVKNDEMITRSEALNQYYHTRNKEVLRANGFVSEDGEVLIPEEIIYQPRDEIYTEQDLEQYISTQSVSTPTGRWPVMLRTQEVMHTVAELNANPRLKNPEFKEITWQVQTYRGYIPISQEAIDDSAVDLLGLIARHILRIELNTTNNLVAPLIKNYRSAIATSLDDLKKMDNVLLDQAYQRVFYMSRSMYNYLDTMKDKDGDYILQRDIESPSGTSLFGHPIVRINDTLIGDYNGQLVCFFGDLKAAITKFNRKTISAQWNDNDLYDTNIQAGFRAGYSVCDENAGYYVLFAPPEKDIELETSDEQTPETVAGVSADITVTANQATIKYTGLTGQPIAFGLKKGDAQIAEMKGRFESKLAEDQIDITFGQDMVQGEYTLEAKVLDSKKYKTIKSVKLNIKGKSAEAAKVLGGAPIIISNV